MKPQFTLRMLMVMTAIVAVVITYYIKRQTQFVKSSGKGGGFICSKGEYSYNYDYSQRRNGEFFLLPLLIAKKPSSNQAPTGASGISINQSGGVMQMTAYGHQIPIVEGSVVYFDEHRKMFVLRDLKSNIDLLKDQEKFSAWLIDIVENLSKYHDDL
jgi:hypothetical protein